MNPDLEKALARLKELGATPDQMQQYLVESGIEGHAGKPFVNAQPDTVETAGDKAAGAISSAYQGMTLGAGNKITAGIRSVLPQKLGGTKGFDYGTALKEQTNVLDSFRGKHPIAAIGTEIAGVLPTIAFQGLRAAAGAGKLARVGRAAAIGTGYGATAGGLEAVRPDATLGSVAKGVGYGAAAGTTIGGAIPAGGMLASAVKKAPGAALSLGRDVVGAKMGNPLAIGRLAVRAGKALSRGGDEAVESVVPKAEGLQSAFETAAERQSQSGVVGTIQAQRAAVVEAVKKAKPRHRTQSSFDDFAQRMGKEPQQPPHRTSAPLAPEPPQGLAANEAGAAQDILTQLRRQQPSEVGSKWSDADIALGKDMPEPDLIDLLRRSLAARGGVPAPNR